MTDLNILKVQQEVYMGDHADTVTTAVTSDPDETVGALVARTIRADRLPGRTYLVIRVAAGDDQ